MIENGHFRLWKCVLVASIDDVRPLGHSLERSYEVLVRDRVKRLVAGGEPPVRAGKRSDEDAGGDEEAGTTHRPGRTPAVR